MSDDSERNLKEILLPTTGQTIISIGLSLLIFVILFRDVIGVRYLHLEYIHNTFSDPGFVAEFTDGTTAHLTNLIVPAFFWVTVGLVAYTLVWAAINVMVEARNEVVIETKYTNLGNYQQRVRRPLLQVAAAIGFFIALILASKWLFPAYITLMGQFMLASHLWSFVPLIKAIGAIAASSATIYAIWMLGQLVFWVD